MSYKSQIIVFAFACCAGCVSMPFWGPSEISSTETFRVTPANGVWDEEYGRTEDAASCSFDFRVFRLKDGIGVQASVFDDRIVTDDCAPGAITCASWNDDTFQCYFDGDNDKSTDSRVGNGLKYGGEFALVANGAAQSDFSSQPNGFGKTWKGSVTRSARPEGGIRVDYDLWFSWGCLGYRRAPKPTEDITFGFNACIHDDDTGGRADRALYWKGSTFRPYRNESRFGTITLKGGY